VKKLTPPQIIVIAFITTILLGTLLLLLPGAHTTGPLTLTDALFTATSATCVTGLVVVDTGTHFTLFGQLVILLLIQIGGMGIMTLGTFFIISIGVRLRWQDRDIVTRTLTGERHLDIWGLLRNVFWLTLGIEAAGTILLAGRFLHQHGMEPARAVYNALFHSVSAFCNAGFSLNADSFIAYQTDPVINFILMLLIIAGGLGYTVLIDMGTFGPRSRRLTPHRRLTLHSRFTLVFTGILILGGGILFLALEAGNTLVDLSWPHKIVGALFQAVTPRTAGFNTVEIAQASNAALMLLILLMFIGGAPGSCAGGIKVTTMGVLLLLARSRIRGLNDVVLFKRRIREKTVAEAMGIMALGVATVAIFTFLLVIVETGGQSHAATEGEFIRLFFETVSAFGTVGLSTGVTPELSTVGRLLITLLMFVGRIGPLTMAIAVAARARRTAFRFVEDKVMVG